MGELIKNGISYTTTTNDALSIDYDNKDSGLEANNVQDAVDEMCVNFQAGVDTIYNAVVEAGATPEDKTPSGIADAIVNELNSLQRVEYIGRISTSQSLNVSSKEGYKSFTKSNFLFTNIIGYCRSEGPGYDVSGSAQMNFSHNWSYNSSSGVITFNGTYMNFNTYSWRGTGWIQADVYLIY